MGGESKANWPQGARKSDCLQPKSLWRHSHQSNFPPGRPNSIAQSL